MKKTHTSVKLITSTALLLAMNIIMSMSAFSIPVPGGHMYLNDVIIVTAAILLDPLHAFIVGGIGAFIGDFLFYPAPMFVSLVTHGLQAVIISLCTRHLLHGKKIPASVIGAAIGWVITVIGYTFGRAYIYSTPAYAVLKLPFQILQTFVGSGAALLLCWKCGIVKFFDKIIGIETYTY
ncbi:MAG: ECF transporter S component [Eubacteriales bacterium]|nr:ECF transporter S component [Eubacteriales bacterium]